jgi:hypothetical protein
MPGDREDQQGNAGEDALAQQIGDGAWRAPMAAPEKQHGCHKEQRGDGLADQHSSGQAEARRQRRQHKEVAGERAGDRAHQRDIANRRNGGALICLHRPQIGGKSAKPQYAERQRRSQRQRGGACCCLAPAASRQRARQERCRPELEQAPQTQQPPGPTSASPALQQPGKDDQQCQQLGEVLRLLGAGQGCPQNAAHRKERQAGQPVPAQCLEQKPAAQQIGGQRAKAPEQRGWLLRQQAKGQKEQHRGGRMGIVFLRRRGIDVAGPALHRLIDSRPIQQTPGGLIILAEVAWALADGDHLLHQQDQREREHRSPQQRAHKPEAPGARRLWFAGSGVARLAGRFERVSIKRGLLCRWLFQVWLLIPVQRRRSWRLVSS